MAAAGTVLYTYWRSSCSWRVRIALNLKGIAYEARPVHLVKKEQNTADYGELNPSHKVPTLLIDGLTLNQSLAIIEYLEETRPEPVALLPAAPAARAQTRAIALMIAADIQPIQNLSVLEYVGDEKRAEWARFWIERGLQAVERVLVRTAGAYCVGDALSLADLCLVPQVYNAKRFAVDMTQFPTIVRVAEALELLPAFAAAHPDAQPDKQ